MGLWVPMGLYRVLWGAIGCCGGAVGCYRALWGAVVCYGALEGTLGHTMGPYRAL